MFVVYPRVEPKSEHVIEVRVTWVPVLLLKLRILRVTFVAFEFVKSEHPRIIKRALVQDNVSPELFEPFKKP